jgi:hypothetical protein
MEDLIGIQTHGFFRTPVQSDFWGGSNIRSKASFSAASGSDTQTSHGVFDLCAISENVCSCFTPIRPNVPSAPKERRKIDMEGHRLKKFDSPNAPSKGPGDRNCCLIPEYRGHNASATITCSAFLFRAYRPGISKFHVPKKVIHSQTAHLAEVASPFDPLSCGAIQRFFCVVGCLRPATSLR